MGIDILIPVLSRPHNVKPLLESVQVTEAPYRVIFLCSPHDPLQIRACERSGAETLIVNWPAGKADYAKKINYGFEHSDSEWVFQGADDLKFHPGWDVEALADAERHGRDVIGINDLHNPRVLRGLGSTHTLFSRSYIEEQGGTTDNTGTVLCELYDHQYVDNEFVETARKRKVWVFCRTAIVEHMHPAWGLAKSDKTYKKALRNSLADYHLFQRRVMGGSARLTREERSLARQAMRKRAR